MEIKLIRRGLKCCIFVDPSKVDVKKRSKNVLLQTIMQTSEPMYDRGVKVSIIVYDIWANKISAVVSYFSLD